MAVIRLGNLLWRPHTRPISPEDPVDVKDVNTADIKAKLEMVQSELALVKAELQEIKANQLSGDQKVQLSGTIDTVNYFANINDLSSNSELYFSDLIIGRAPYIQFSFRFNKSTWKTIQISFHTHTGDPITDTSFIELPRGGYIYGTGSQMSGITKDIPLLSPYYKIGIKASGATGVRMSSMAIVYKDSPTNPLDWLLEEGE